MLILDGRKLKEERKLALQKEVALLLEQIKILPKLIILQVGDNAVSDIYIRQKMNFAKQIGVSAELIRFPETVLENELLTRISELNNDSQVHGIILQLPIAGHLDKTKIINRIDSAKDVDGLGAANIYKLINNDSSGIIPATARGIAALLKRYDIKIAGQNVAVLGRSLLVGKTVSLSFINLNATVTVCHSQTKNLTQILKAADIIISAVGKPGIINDQNIGENQTIIDVGISQNKTGQISGDVILESRTAAAISPVPGGVGQMTVTSLFENLIDAYKKQHNL